MVIYGNLIYKNRQCSNFPDHWSDISIDKKGHKVCFKHKICVAGYRVISPFIKIWPSLTSSKGDLQCILEYKIIDKESSFLINFEIFHIPSMILYNLLIHLINIHSVLAGNFRTFKSTSIPLEILFKHWFYFVVSSSFMI